SEVLGVAANSGFGRACAGGDLAGRRVSQELSRADNQQSLSNAGIQECGTVVGDPENVSDDRNKKRRSGAESRGGRAGGKSPLIGKPLERDAHGSAINQGR